MINLQKTMENENDFRIRTYTKRELACLYCPNTTARCAIRTLTRWIKRNSELRDTTQGCGHLCRGKWE